MSEKTANSKIEAAALEILDGEKQKQLLSFAAWLRANKLSPSWFRETQFSRSKTWKVSFKGKGICRIHLVYDGPNARSWYAEFNSFGRNDEFLLMDEGSEEIAWKNIRYCCQCSGCRPGRHVTVGSKEIDRVCNNSLTFYDPGAVEIECIKDLIKSNCGLIQPGSTAAYDPSADPAVLANEQKLAKPEDCFPNSREFIMYLQANKMPPRFTIWNWWEANCKGLICNLRLAYPWQKHMYSWAVGVHLNHIEENKDEIISQGLQNIILDNIVRCINCGRPKCAPGKTMTVLGQEIKGVCAYCPPTITWVYDPDEGALDCIKKLIELEKKAR